MKNDLNHDDLDTMKRRYPFTVLDGLCYIQNNLNYICFIYYLEGLGLEKQLELCKEKIENNYERNSDAIKYNENKQILEKIIDEYKTIKNEAKSAFQYSDTLIKQMENDFKKTGTESGALKIYRNVCGDIMNIAVRKYMKCEKSLVMLLDKFKDINN